MRRARRHRYASDMSPLIPTRCTLYCVRFHVRADAATNGRGEAFCCQLGGKSIAPRIEEMKEGWQWYEFGPRKLHEDLVLSFASGRFANGGGSPAVKGVRIDRVEIVRDKSL